MTVTQEVLPALEMGHALPIAARRRGWLIRRALLTADLVGLMVAFVVAQVVFGPDTTGSSLDRIGPQEEYVLFLATLPFWVLLAKAYRLYANDEERTDHSTVDEVVGIFHLVTVGAFVVLVASWLTGAAAPQFGKIFAFWLIGIGLVSLGRASARAVCRRQTSYMQSAIIVGCGHVGQTVARKFLNHPEYGVHVVGFIDAEPRDIVGSLRHLPVLGTTANLPQIVDALRIDRVIVAFSSDSHEETLALIRSTKDLDVQVDVVPRLFEMITPTVQMHSIEGIPLLSMPPMRLSRSDRLIKRSVDLVLASLALVVLAPLFLVVAAAIKIDSRGPVFFRQERVGVRDQRFRMWKFRSMAVDAEARRTEIAHLNSYLGEGATPIMFKASHDPRVTTVGRFLRRTSIDELPQLLNVMRGEMSLVGPRPLIPSEDRHVGEWGRRRLDLRPGMTGLWQVLGRNDIPFSEMVGLDYRYVTTWSIKLDMTLALQTARAVMRPTVEARRPLPSSVDG